MRGDKAFYISTFLIVGKLVSQQLEIQGAECVFDRRQAFFQLRPKKYLEV